jgi:hypothetical protein
MLKPVLRISNDAEILGIFRGFFSLAEFTIHIDYPNGSKSGKDVFTEIQFGDQVFVDFRSSSPLFNYNAKWDNFSKDYFLDKHYNDNSINILFMADGYTSPGSLLGFISDVQNNLMPEIKDSKWEYRAN